MFLEDKIEMVIAKLSMLQKTEASDFPKALFAFETVHKELDNALILLEEIRDDLKIGGVI